MSLTAAEIETMRTVVEEYLPDTAVVWRATAVNDGQGGGSATWASVGTATCRKGLPESRREIEMAARLGEVAVWIITLPHDVDVTAKDRLIIGSTTLEVVGPSGEPSWNLGRRLLTTEVR